jgi:hypothetical protein
MKTTTPLNEGSYKTKEKAVKAYSQRSHDFFALLPGPASTKM